MIVLHRSIGIILLFLLQALAFKNMLKHNRLFVLRNDENKVVDIGGTKMSKMLFTASETLGQISNLGRSNNGQGKTASSAAPRSFKEAEKRILSEYDEIFFATGKMDMVLWAENCTFADPFNSFGGPGSLERFKSNSDNFSRFLLDPTLKIVSVTSSESDGTVMVSWVFRSVLKLPWRPILAAAGETKHFLDKNQIIIRYEERWKSNPWDVVKRLFFPGNGK